MDALIDSLRGYASKKGARYDARMFVFAFAAAVLIHLYAFTHKFINHDDVNGLFDDCSFGLSSGRFLLQAVSKLNGAFSSPWLNGLAGALFLALAVVLLLRLFRVRRYTTGALLAVTLLAFPTVASTYAYMFCSYQYLVAMAASALGACLIRREGRWSALAGALVIALGMGCYQAYFSLAAALLALCYFLELSGNRWAGKALPAVRAAVKYVLSLLLALALYLVILKICLAVTGTQLTDYQGISSMGRVTVAVLLARCAAAYAAFAGFYRTLLPHLRFVLAAAFLLCLVLRVVRSRVYRSPWSLLLLALDAAVLPLACGSVHLMTDAENVHGVMEYAFVLPLLFPALAAESLPSPPAGAARKRQLAAVCACVLLLAQLSLGVRLVRLTNQAYFNMGVTYENVYAFYTKLLAKIELQDGFKADTPVALLGRAHMDSAVPELELTGVLAGDDALNIYSRQQLLSYYFATDYVWASQEQCAAIAASDAFRAMPCYPDSGSIQELDGVIVVKFSELS